MADIPRAKSPLDVLQSMINAILIETGKALRASNKESGKSLTHVNTRLRSTIPSTIENFHQALDDIECDIVRAKSVLLRDLEEMRAKRKTLEDPIPIIEEVQPDFKIEDITQSSADPITTEQSSQASGQATISSPPVSIKLEKKRSSSPEKQTPTPNNQAQATDSSKETSSGASSSHQAPAQGLTPPSSVNKPVGLGIGTENSTAEPASAPQDSTMDTLFGAEDTDLNFDSMDFMTQSNEPQHDEFDMANFGSTSQDFNMADLNTSTQTSTANNGTANKPDDIFSMDTTQSVDNMDLDFDLGGSTEFNDMFDAGTELDHALDSSFFDDA